MPKIYNDACETVSSIKMVSKDASLASPWLKTVIHMACLALAAMTGYYSYSTPHMFWNTFMFETACVLGTYFALIVIWKILSSIIGSIVAWFKGEKNDQLALKQYEGPLVTFNIKNNFSLYKRNGDTQ